MQMCVDVLLYPGMSGATSSTHAASQHPRSTIVRGDRAMDDWDRERAKHQRILNETRLTPTGISHQPPATENNWPPCVDNTACEIQLSLVEQQQKMLNQKKQQALAAKLQTSSHGSLHNGHSDALSQNQSVLQSLDNRTGEEKYISANRHVHSKSEREFLHGTDLTHRVGSRGDRSRSLDDFRSDLNTGSRDVPAYYKPSPDVPSATMGGVDEQFVEEREFDANEDQMRKKQKRLHHLHGSEKSGKLLLHHFGFCLV